MEQKPRNNVEKIIKITLEYIKNTKCENSQNSQNCAKIEKKPRNYVKMEQNLKFKKCKSNFCFF